MELLIRPARMEDLKGIWELLHASAIVWTDVEIEAELSRLWVMLQDAKMLGVLYGNFETGVKRIEWVAIHPFYHEKQLREAMVNGICGTFDWDKGQRRVLKNQELVRGLV